MFFVDDVFSQAFQLFAGAVMAIEIIARNNAINFFIFSPLVFNIKNRGGAKLLRRDEWLYYNCFTCCVLFSF